LDLNGFSIVASSGSVYDGIQIKGSTARVTVRNGTIRGFPYGIRCVAFVTWSYLFEKLQVTACSIYGIYAGDATRVVDCRAHYNYGNGIYVGDYSAISGCVAYSNDGDGIYTGAGASILDCVSSGNEGIGIHGGDGALISRCTVQSNQGDYGIQAGHAASVLASHAYNNTGSGTFSYGIYTGQGSLVEQCVVRSSGHTNTTDSASDQGVGIFAGKHSTVRGCSVTLNQGDGIRIYQNSLVQNNMCQQNGINGDGAGVHATSGDNVIDGNTVVYCVRGIDVDMGNNMIIRNRVRSCTSANYSIAGGNKDAQILTPGSGFTSTDPWANFSF
jgi:parallel beta-helix repeat protein